MDIQYAKLEKFVKAEKVPAGKDTKAARHLTITGYIGMDFDGGALINYFRMFVDPDEEVVLDVFSFGGSPFDTLAIYDFFKTTDYSISAVNIYGMCGSAATLIAAACNPGGVGIGRNSFMLVHNAFNGATGEQDETSKQISEKFVDIYTEYTGLSKREVRRLMNEGDEGYLLDATQAVRLGFADKKLKEVQSVAARYYDVFKADFNKQNFQKMEKSFFDQIKGFFKIEANTEEELLTKLEELDQTVTAETIQALTTRLEALEANGNSDDSGEAGTEYVPKSDFDALSQQLEQVTETLGTLSEKFTEFVEANGEQEQEQEEQTSKVEETLAAINAKLTSLATARSGQQASGQADAVNVHTNGNGGDSDKVTTTADVDAIKEIVTRAKSRTGTKKISFGRN